MSILVQSIHIAVVALFGLGVGVDLLQIVKAIGQRDWATARHFGFLLLQHGLFLASCILLMRTRHASRVPIYLVVTALFLNVVGSGTFRRVFVGRGVA